MSDLTESAYFQNQDGVVGPTLLHLDRLSRSKWSQTVYGATSFMLQ